MNKLMQCLTLSLILLSISGCRKEVLREENGSVIGNNTLRINETNYSISGISSSTSGGDFIITGTSGSMLITVRAEDPVDTFLGYGLSSSTTSFGFATVYITNLPGSSGAYITTGSLYYSASGTCYKANLYEGLYLDGSGNAQDVFLSITCP